MSNRTDRLQERCAVRQRMGQASRAFDFLCAASALLALSPLFCLVAVAIKLDDGGPVLYKQPRVGKNFQPFLLYKFRSMVTGADRSGLLTAPGDSRLTRVGCWLRHYKIDELPQLVNVLKGEMQLVGARPEVERYVEMFPSQYALILRERPGITDPATFAFRHEEQLFQVDRMEEQYVSEILPTKLKLSIEYQKKRNLVTDIRMLWQTVAKLIA